MHEVLVNRLGGLSLPRKSVVRLTDRPDTTLDVYRGRKTTMQQCNNRTSAERIHNRGAGRRACVQNFDGHFLSVCSCCFICCLSVIDVLFVMLKLFTI